MSCRRHRSGHVTWSSVTCWILTSLMCCRADIAVPDRLTDYCQGKSFEANCSRPTEVLLMQSGRYGRMTAGHCISANTGCSDDVLWYMDRRCSGRTHCKIYVADPVLHHLNPCSNDYTSYLEAKYTCISAATDVEKSKAECRQTGRVTLSSDTGYISSELRVTGADADCGWVIAAEPGQHVQLSLVAFGGDDRLAEAADSDREVQQEVDGGRSNVCHEVGTVWDDGQSPLDILVVCGPGHSDRQAARETTLLQSRSHRVVVQLQPHKILQFLSPFVIKYTVVGCVKPSAPVGGWVRMEDFTAAMVGCNITDDVWTLTCVDGQWSSAAGNCTPHADTDTSWETSSLFQTSYNFPYGVLLVVAVGVALGVFVGGVLLTIAALFMKRSSAASRTALPAHEADDLAPQELAYHTFVDCELHRHYHYGRHPRYHGDQQQQQQQHLLDGQTDELRRDRTARCDIPPVGAETTGYDVKRLTPNSDVDKTSLQLHGRPGHHYESAQNVQLVYCQTATPGSLATCTHSHALPVA